MPPMPPPGAGAGSGPDAMAELIEKIKNLELENKSLKKELQDKTQGSNEALQRLNSLPGEEQGAEQEAGTQKQAPLT